MACPPYVWQGKRNYVCSLYILEEIMCAVCIYLKKLCVQFVLKEIMCAVCIYSKKLCLQFALKDIICAVCTR